MTQTHWAEDPRDFWRTGTRPDSRESPKSMARRSRGAETRGACVSQEWKLRPRRKRSNPPQAQGGVCATASRRTRPVQRGHVHSVKRCWCEARLCRCLGNLVRLGSHLLSANKYGCNHVHDTSNEHLPDPYERSDPVTNSSRCTCEVPSVFAKTCEVPTRTVQSGARGSVRQMPQGLRAVSGISANRASRRRARMHAKRLCKQIAKTKREKQNHAQINPSHPCLPDE